jgi:hypothetical protein
MYLKLIDGVETSYKAISTAINNFSKNKIILIRFYENITVILELEKYNISFLIKYKIHNYADILYIFMNIKKYLTKELDSNNYIDLKWNYYFKCSSCTLKNLLVINNFDNNSENNHCTHCGGDSGLSNRLIELPNNKLYHIDCINANPECIYDINADVLLQCEFCNKYILSELINIKYRKNIECYKYYWKEIINNSIINYYNMSNCNNSNFLFINLKSL